MISFKRLRRSLGWKAYREFTPATDELLYGLFSIPKSGSNALLAALDILFEPPASGKEWPKQMYFPKGLHVTIPLHQNVALSYPKGGRVHSHIGPNFSTLEVLKQIGIPHLLLLRHPLDQLTAYYCHLRKNLRRSDVYRVAGHEDLIITIPETRCEHRYFKQDTDIDEAIAYMIEDGMLEATIRWMTDWLQFRDEKQSLIMRYEDLFSKPAIWLPKIAAFLSPKNTTHNEALLNSAIETGFTSYVTHSTQLSEDKHYLDYPHGYTGSEGCYEGYVSKNNIQRYQHKLKALANGRMNLEALEARYPNLYLG